MKISGRPQIEQRLLEKIEAVPFSGCWIWMGSLRAVTGYGQVCVAAGRTKLAHRVSYELFRGPIPEGMDVCHSCDVTACINPSHLFLGTHADNMRDMIRKGRRRPKEQRGEKNSSALLTTQNVKEIRERRAAGELVKNIALAYGVSRHAITDVCKRKTWRHV